ncbi:subtilisin-like protein [Lactarius deliciosus]|nr:subtilisin-like protein [Lactarius deliciosus]
MRYHWLYVLSFLTATSLADFATPLAHWSDVRVKHAWSSVPTNWETMGCPSAGTTIDLYIALNPRHENALIDALYEVSDPQASKARPSHRCSSRTFIHVCCSYRFRYGAHLSKEQVAELVSPHPDTLELVTSWLAHHGVQPSSISTTHGGAWLTVRNVLVSQANEMLGASYQLYRHAKVNDTIIRTVSYALPEVLHAQIQAVAPTTYFTSTRTLRQTSRRRSVEAAAALVEADAVSGKSVAVLSSRAGEVTPSRLRGLYKTFAYVPTAADRNTLGVFGFQKQYPSETDLSIYMTNFRSDVQPPSLATFTVELVNGARYDPDTPSIEASIDVQYASAMAYPTPIIFLHHRWLGELVGQREPLPGDVYLESLEYLLKKSDIPQTISISYGTYEWNVPQEYAKALCILFAQLGARGVSVLFPTGDDGVGKNCMDDSGNVRFVAEFPASYYDPEVAAALSGGGFSDHFLAQSTRTSLCPHSSSVRHPACWPLQVRSLLSPDSNRLLLCNSCSPEGRGIPDIAAQALKFITFVKNCWHYCRGHELLDSRPPLGFLNIRLYDDGLAGFNDITSGSNPGCGTDGFSAVPGWDPVTGLGTPDFEKLQNIFMTPLGGGAGQGDRPKIRGPE